MLSGIMDDVVVSATSSQKSSSSLSGLPVLDPAIIAAFTAPIDVPETISNSMPCLDSAL
jgi:hypothetical protein